MKQRKNDNNKRKWKRKNNSSSQSTRYDTILKQIGIEGKVLWCNTRKKKKIGI